MTDTGDKEFYFTIDKEASTEFKERGSRFIAFAYPVASKEDFKKYLQSPQWLNLTDFEYSFKIYSLVPLDPDSMQNVLELKSISARIGFLIDILTRETLQ